MARLQAAALGFSVHTGWASLVAVAGPLDGPQVVDRRRLALLDGPDADAGRFVYHLASELELPAAKKLVDRTTAAANKTTLAGLRAAAGELADRGYRIARAAVIGGGAGPTLTLESILRSHTAIHAAEGKLYRDAIAAACRALACKILEIPARQLGEATSKQTGLSPGRLEKHASAMKRLVGPPWGQDQKQAMLAAWAALADAGSKSRARLRR
jgi:hypothetical protein